MSKRRFILLAFLGLATSGCTAERRAETACKSKLAEQLVAPTSLKVVEVRTGEPGAITRDDMLQLIRFGIAEDETRFSALSNADRLVLQYRKELLRDKPEELLRNVGTPDLERTIGVLITYDAQNRMGVPLRANFFCRVLPYDNTEKAHVFTSFDVPAAEVGAFKKVLS